MVFIIKTLYFNYYDDFACTVADKYDDVDEFEDYNSVAIVAKYNEAKKIICELINIGYGIDFIDGFVSPQWSEYSDEFYISLYNDEICCEVAKDTKGYLFVEANTVYLLGNCSSKIIPKIDAKEIYEVNIDEEDIDECVECDGDCGNCECTDILEDSNVAVSEIKLSKDNQHGFTVSKTDGDSYTSYSYYTTENLSENDIQRLLKAFGF